jgi:type VI secretion system secreted protein Hcp
MVQSAFLSVTGQKQGKIRGPVTLPGRKDMMTVIAGNHEIVSPRDAASGLPIGQRLHKPLTIVKEVDCSSSPRLMSALVTNENLIEVSLQLWQQDRVGRDVLFYTIRLVNANVSDIRMSLSFDSSSLHPAREEVTFVYQNITWTCEPGGASVSDDWEARV